MGAAVLRNYIRVGNPDSGFKKIQAFSCAADQRIRPLIAANWKMFKTIDEARQFVWALVNKLHWQPNTNPDKIDVSLDVDVVIAPPATALSAVASELSTYRERYVKLEPTIFAGIQNIHWEAKGAFTGEVSAAQALDAGAKFAIIGHSERRQLFGETDDTVKKKTISALEHGLRPIVCVGETLEQRDGGNTLSIIESQLKAGLLAISADNLPKVTIAYEPVWAIGTGLTASPEQAEEVHAFIRKIVWESWGGQIAQSLRILYGGSVKPDNIAALMAMHNIDGALVGGASLKADDFGQIVRFGLS
jgi:triosephosphate isomerase